MLGERGFKFFIYLISTFVLFTILKDSTFFHKYIGGNTDEALYFSNYPCQIIPPFLSDFYCFKISYHLYELMFALIYHYERVDFPEYLLHHILTLTLIVFSYTVNFLPIGAVIMYVHDLTDLFVCLFKLTCDTHSHRVQYSLFVCMLVSWFYFRLCFFPGMLIRRYYLEVYTSQDFVIQNIFMILFCFLVGLFLLHIFWFHLMLRGLCRRLAKPERISLETNENKQ